MEAILKSKKDIALKGKDLQLNEESSLVISNDNELNKKIVLQMLQNGDREQVKQVAEHVFSGLGWLLNGKTRVQSISGKTELGVLDCLDKLFVFSKDTSKKFESVNSEHNTSSAYRNYIKSRLGTYKSLAQKDKRNVSEHIDNIFAEGKTDEQIAEEVASVMAIYADVVDYGSKVSSDYNEKVKPVNDAIKKINKISATDVTVTEYIEHEEEYERISRWVSNAGLERKDGKITVKSTQSNRRIYTYTSKEVTSETEMQKERQQQALYEEKISVRTEKLIAVQQEIADIYVEGYNVETGEITYKEGTPDLVKEIHASITLEINYLNEISEKNESQLTEVANNYAQFTEFTDNLEIVQQDAVVYDTKKVLKVMNTYPAIKDLVNGYVATQTRINDFKAEVNEAFVAITSKIYSKDANLEEIEQNINKLENTKPDFINDLADDAEKTEQLITRKDAERLLEEVTNDATADADAKICAISILKEMISKMPDPEEYKNKMVGHAKALLTLRKVTTKEIDEAEVANSSVALKIKKIKDKDVIVALNNLVPFVEAGMSIAKGMEQFALIAKTRKEDEVAEEIKASIQNEMGVFKTNYEKLDGMLDTPITKENKDEFIASINVMAEEVKGAYIEMFGDMEEVKEVYLPAVIGESVEDTIKRIAEKPYATSRFVDILKQVVDQKEKEVVTEIKVETKNEDINKEVEEEVTTAPDKKPITIRFTRKKEDDTEVNDSLYFDSISEFINRYSTNSWYKGILEDVHEIEFNGTAIKDKDADLSRFTNLESIIVGKNVKEIDKINYKKTDGNKIVVTINDRKDSDKINIDEHAFDGMTVNFFKSLLPEEVYGKDIELPKKDAEFVTLDGETFVRVYNEKIAVKDEEVTPVPSTTPVKPVTPEASTEDKTTKSTNENKGIVFELSSGKKFACESLETLKAGKVDIKEVVAIRFATDTIPSGAVDGFDKLERVYIDKKVKSIEAEAFKGAPSLKIVKLDADVKGDAVKREVCDIKDAAFKGVPKDTQVTYATTGHAFGLTSTPKDFMNYYKDGFVLPKEATKVVKKEEKIDKDLIDRTNEIVTTATKDAKKFAKLPKSKTGKWWHRVLRHPVLSLIGVALVGGGLYLGATALFAKAAFAAASTAIATTFGSMIFVGLGVSLGLWIVKQGVKLFSKSYRKMFLDAKLEAKSRKALKALFKANAKVSKMESIKEAEIKLVETELAKKEPNIKKVNAILKKRDKAYRKAHRIAKRALKTADKTAKKIENIYTKRELLVEQIIDRQRERNLEVDTNAIEENNASIMEHLESIKSAVQGIKEKKKAVVEEKVFESEDDKDKGDYYKNLLAGIKGIKEKAPKAKGGSSIGERLDAIKTIYKEKIVELPESSKDGMEK